MEHQRLKLEDVRQRLLNGERVKSTRQENNRYIVQFTNKPEITFDENYKQTVDKTIEKAINHVMENKVDNSTTSTTVREGKGF